MRIQKALTFFAAAIFAIGVLAGRVEAAPIIYVDPATTFANVGDTIDVDLFLDNTGGGPVGGFSLFLDFSDSKLQGSGFTSDPDSNFTGGVDLSVFGPGGTAVLDMFFFGTPIAAQPAVFRLARVSFLALTDGFSPLDLSGAIVSNQDGTQFQTASTRDGRVCIGGPCPTVVPEPGLLALATAAAAAFGVRRRAKR